jgi:hypothetical protein
MYWFDFKERLRHPSLFWRDIKHFWQRRTRGWDNSDTYSLDFTIGRFIYPRLKKFKELNKGFPGGLTSEKWDEILDKMIAAFEIIADDKQYWTMNEEQYRIVKRGLKLFYIYYRDLWW